MTALVGTVAQFRCAGTGLDIFWLVDELPLTDSSIIGRGIVAHKKPMANSVKSNLTVPATIDNNGTFVRCVLTASSNIPVIISGNATLNVLPGMC